MDFRWKIVDGRTCGLIEDVIREGLKLVDFICFTVLHRLG